MKTISEDVQLLPVARSPLLSLPAELRESIYHFVFYPPAQQQGPVPLFEARPPRKEFLLANKQNYHEANAIYQAAYCQYWTDTTFILHYHDLPDHYPNTSQSRLLLEQIPLSRTDHLQVVINQGDEKYTWHLVHRGGGWRLELPDNYNLFVCLRGWITMHPYRVSWIGRESENEIREVCERAPSVQELVDQILLLGTVPL